MTEQGKQCPNCAEVKPATEYGNDASRQDGLSFYCRACGNAKKRNGRLPKTVSERPCRECQTLFTPPHFNAHYCSEGCRAGRQTRRQAESGRAWYEANQERHNETSRRWYAANRERRCEQIRVYRVNNRDRYLHWHSEQQRRSRGKNREAFNAYMRDYERQRQTLKAAKSRPEPFAFVRYTYRGEVFYRAGRVDRPIGPNESVLARYEPYEGRWVIHAPSVVPPAFKTLVQRLVRRERFGKARRWKEAI